MSLKYNSIYVFILKKIDFFLLTNLLFYIHLKQDKHGNRRL